MKGERRPGRRWTQVLNPQIGLALQKQALNRVQDLIPCKGPARPEVKFHAAATARAGPTGCGGLIARLGWLVGYLAGWLVALRLS